MCEHETINEFVQFIMRVILKNSLTAIRWHNCFSFFFLFFYIGLHYKEIAMWSSVCDFDRLKCMSDSRSFLLLFFVQFQTIGRMKSRSHIVCTYINNSVTWWMALEFWTTTYNYCMNSKWTWRFMQEIISIWYPINMYAYIHIYTYSLCILHIRIRICILHIRIYIYIHIHIL